MKLNKIKYQDLNSRAQETYNFHKMASILADYGYNCIRLSDDWNGADCIAVHIDGISDMKIQLKGSLSFDQKYRGKDLQIGFFDDLRNLYIYPHDLVLEKVEPDISDKRWLEIGKYFQTKLTKKFKEVLEPYKIESCTCAAKRGASPDD